MIEVTQFLARQRSAPVRRRKRCVALRPDARQCGSLPVPSPYTLDVDIHKEYADSARSQRVKQNGAVPRRSLVKSTLLARLHFEISRSALLPGATITRQLRGIAPFLLRHSIRRRGESRLCPKARPEFADCADNVIQAGRRCGFDDKLAVGGEIFVP